MYLAESNKRNMIFGFAGTERKRIKQSHVQRYFRACINLLNVNTFDMCAVSVDVNILTDHQEGLVCHIPCVYNY